MTKLIITIQEMGPKQFRLDCEQTADGTATPLDRREAVAIAVALKHAIERKAEYSKIEEVPFGGQS